MVQLDAASEGNIHALTDADDRIEFALPGSKPAQLTVSLISQGGRCPCKSSPCLPAPLADMRDSVVVPSFPPASGLTRVSS